MELKIKLLKWSAGLPIATLNYKTAEKIGLHPQDTISLKTLSKKPKETSAVVDVIRGFVNQDEIAISSELKKQLNLRLGAKVEINILTPTGSIEFIKKKMKNKPLSEEEINTIIRDVVNNSLSDMELALFISAVYKYGMNMKETIFLIKAIQKSGTQMNFRQKLIADKHSIGGVPGNRTTPIVVAICAAAGLIVPKNSSRAITSAAGTADVIETIARVEFTAKEIKKIVRKTGACLIWGGALGLVPADSRIIRVERSLKIDPEAMLVASIMSKKLAAGSNYILIDIPYGEGAKVDETRARKLKKKFEYLGKYFHKKIECILTDGSQPIGCGIGPVCELEDVINVLDPKKVGPEDLEKKSLILAGKLLEMTGKAKEKQGIKIAKEILYSGIAFEKFKEIIKAQEGDLKRIKIAKFKHNIFSKKSGKIKFIDNKKINSLARAVGCPVDKRAGLRLCWKRGDSVKKGDMLLTLYAESTQRIASAMRYYEKFKPIHF